MTKCVNCGSEAENASYCPECGAMIIREAISQSGAPSADQPVTEAPAAPPFPEETPLYSSGSTGSSSYDSTSGYNSDSDGRSGYSGESPVQTAPIYQPTQGGYAPRPSGSGQMIFAVINIIVGAIMCCCGGLGLPALVLAIIAAVMASGANKAVSAEEAESKIKTAKILNIIAIILAGLAILIAIIFSIVTRDIDPNTYAYGSEFSNLFGS